jgi:hypothetical protein
MASGDRRPGSKDLDVGLQHVGDAAEDGDGQAVIRQVLEEQESLERCVDWGGPGVHSPEDPVATRWSSVDVQVEGRQRALNSY